MGADDEEGAADGPDSGRVPVEGAVDEPKKPRCEAGVVADYGTDVGCRAARIVDCVVYPPVDYRQRRNLGVASDKFSGLRPIEFILDPPMRPCGD